MRRWTISLFLIFLLFPAALPAQKATTSKTNAVALYLFWGSGCPHCNKEKEFLGTLARKYPGLAVWDYEVWHNKENAAFFAGIMKAARVQSPAVPTTVIGNRVFVGFNNETAKAVENEVASCIRRGCVDVVASYREARPSETVREEPKILDLPLVGKIDPSKVSLPLFTVVIGGLDSFNPCAFFVLLFLLSLLIHARSRKRMLLIGGVFVLFSGLIYFLFMAAWLNIFLIIGQLAVITAAAGIIAFFVALLNIKDFFFFKKGVSLTIPEKSKPKLFERMRGLLKSPTLPAMTAGTVVLAVTANAYELLCTAGFPMVYTRVLTLHKLAAVQYYLYLVLYNIVYVIPLAIIVAVITVTLGARKLSEWQGRQLKLVSGLMMLFLGLTLLINPALLNNVLAAVVLLAAALIVSGATIVITKKMRPEIVSR